jgi:anti-sigma B factor antagonist
MITAQAMFRVRAIHPELSAIDIEGEVTGSAEDRFNEAFQQAQSGPVVGILLNFEKMAFMNSRGIGLLIGLLVRANARGQKLAGVGLSVHFQRIFELIRLQDAIPIYASESEALAALVSPK